MDIGEGAILQLATSIAPIVGNILEEKFITKSVQTLKYKNSRINRRLELKQDRRQNNIDSIIKKALEYSKNFEQSNSNVDEDWIFDFFDVSQDCSNENMQYLWSKLLVKEVLDPNTFSRRTLSVIKTLTSEEARVFNLICSCTWILEDDFVGMERVFILDDDTNIDNNYFDERFQFDRGHLNNLENIGLIRLTFIELEKGEEYEISFFGNEHTLKSNSDTCEFTYANLTVTGEEIYEIAIHETNNDYYNLSLNFLKKKEILFK